MMHVVCLSVCCKVTVWCGEYVCDCIVECAMFVCKVFVVARVALVVVANATL